MGWADNRTLTGAKHAIESTISSDAPRRSARPARK